MTETSPLLKSRWKLVVVLLAAVLLATLAVRWWRGATVAVETVIRRDFVQSVVASGRVETAHRVEIGSQITGTVVRVPVNEGQSVKVGDILVELEAAELDAAERQADMAVAQAQGRQRQMREVQVPVAEQALREAEANLAKARSLLRRNQELAQRGFIASAALEEFDRAVTVADAQVKSTQRQLVTAGPAGSDYALAGTAVAEARASADLAGARADYAVIRAPVGGTLIGRNIEVGDVVQAGKVLMTLSPVGRTQLVVEIDEKNLRLLTIGQHALASPDAYPQMRFAADLAYINPGINALTGAVQVKLDVPSPPAELRQDMTVSVDIAVARRPNAVLIPASAVHDGEGGAAWVLLLKDGRSVRRPVRLGLRSGGYAEVLEGLSEGEGVIPASLAIAPGARVRAATVAR
ncbi:MAG TPA: efflux RND transporter periplasmic adaptor subunit [Azonexus sp.]|nr:efflux RND transporter periplasmic adaptor subunit [Azonexus sp.]